MFAQIVEAERKSVPHLAVSVARDADAATLGEALKASGDVYTIAVEATILDDNISNVDAYSKPHLSVLGKGCVLLL
jgi:hypothetical protein